MKEIIVNNKVFRVCVNNFPDIAVSRDGELYCISKNCLLEDKGWKTSKYKTTTSRHINGMILPFPFHRAVALYWIDNPENKTHVNHKNFNKKDNRVENLEWVTNDENMEHYFKSKRTIWQKNKEQSRN